MDTNVWGIPKSDVKNLNKHLAHDLIQFAQGGIFQYELPCLVGITRASVQRSNLLLEPISQTVINIRLKVASRVGKITSALLDWYTSGIGGVAPVI